ncbi:MAG: NUDIX hydrolase [Acidimicrobiales bacterium]
MPRPDTGFEVTAERELYKASFFSVVADEITAPDGKSFEREIIHHPGAVAIVAMEGDDVVMIRQYRAPLRRAILEVPAGKLDVPGEPPEECARRELAEEVGRTAAQWTLLGELDNSPGFTDEHTYCFLAEQLTKVERDTQGAEEHFMTVEKMPLSRLWPLVESGELVDAKTIIAMALAERALKHRTSP